MARPPCWQTPKATLDAVFHAACDMPQRTPCAYRAAALKQGGGRKHEIDVMKQVFLLLEENRARVLHHLLEVVGRVAGNAVPRLCVACKSNGSTAHNCLGRAPGTHGHVACVLSATMGAQILALGGALHLRTVGSMSLDRTK